jgi:hypothetical protein
MIPVYLSFLGELATAANYFHFHFLFPANFGLGSSFFFHCWSFSTSHTSGLFSFCNSLGFRALGFWPF